MLPLILLNVAAHLYQYLMVCVSVVILCLRDPEAERSFRLPLGVAIPAVAAVLCVLLLTQQQPAVNLLAALAVGARAVRSRELQIPLSATRKLELHRARGWCRVCHRPPRRQTVRGPQRGRGSVIVDGEEIALGVRPMEALLAALGTCTAFDVVSILAKRWTTVESYRIELEGERAEDHPRRYTKIRVRHIVSGEGIMQESLERVVTLSHEKYCSVAAPLNSEIDSEAILKYSQPEAYARYETSCRRRSFL